MPMSRIDQVLIAVAVALVVALGGMGWVVVSDAAEGVSPAAYPLSPADAGAPAPPRTPEPSPGSGGIVVDVEGAVVRPGVYHLVSGARVGDAIAAAGGYDSSVDLDGAAMELNLAAPLSDGEKILVPRIAHPGDAAGTAGGGHEPSSGGLVNVNTADAAALEELPGIGPVTAEKIITAREEDPFESLEEMVERGVINNGQLDKIRELATTG